MKNWKDFEREICKRICTRFNEPYVPFQSTKQHRKTGSCRTYPGHPGGDLLKSQRLKRLFPFTIELKTVKTFSTQEFINWILQAINETPEDEDFALVLHKHNSRANAAIIKEEIYYELSAFSDEGENHYMYSKKRFSTKAFWDSFTTAKAQSKENFIISFKLNQLNSKIPDIILSILDFDFFLYIAYARAFMDENVKHLLHEKGGKS